MLPRHLHLALALLAALVLASCGNSSAGYPKYALYRNLASTHGLEVVAPADADLARLRALAERLRVTGAREVVFSAGQDASRGGELPRIVIADGRTPGIEKLLDALEVSLAPGGGSFAFLDRSYEGPDDVLVATCADPSRPGLPVTLYFGIDAVRVASFVRDLTPSWRPAYRCYRDGLIEREGHWNEDGDEVPSAAAADLEALARVPVARFNDPGLELLVHAGVDAGAVAHYRARLKSVRDELLATFGVEAGEAGAARVTIHVWPSAEQLALATGTWAFSSVGPAPRTVHAVLTPWDDDGCAAARAWAMALEGEPAQAWMLDGLALHLAKTWWGKHLSSEWWPYLEDRGLAPDVQTLITPEQRLSPHIALPLRGALFGLLLERDGGAALRAAWQGRGALKLPSDAELASWIARASAGVQPSWRQRRFEPGHDNSFRRALHLLPPRDDDGRGFRGLGTLACERSVRATREVAANAIALSPIAFLDGGYPDWAGDFDDAPFATATPDAALAATCWQARGLKTLFAPQLLTSRSGTWAGWNMVQSEESMSSLFAQLERCAMHYALVAELCNADVLCLGTELGAATRTQFDDSNGYVTPDYMRHNGARWQRVIAASRTAFRGALTYAGANLGEIKQIDFWPELDFVGLDVFRSLAVEPHAPVRPDDAQATALMRGTLQQGAEFARSLGKPLLITELGFPPTSEAWRAPDRAAGSIDLEEQRRLYECTAEALRRAQKSGAALAGICVWSWSTDPEAGGTPDRSFTSQHRPAANALAHLFGRP